MQTSQYVAAMFCFVTKVINGKSSILNICETDWFLVLMVLTSLNLHPAVFMIILQNSPEILLSVYNKLCISYLIVHLLVISFSVVSCCENLKLMCQLGIKGFVLQATKVLSKSWNNFQFSTDSNPQYNKAKNKLYLVFSRHVISIPTVLSLMYPA